MIRLLIDLFIYILVLDAILSFIPSIQNQDWVKAIRKVTNPILNPIRKLLPQDLPFDMAPLAVILLLNIIKVLW